MADADPAKKLPEAKGYQFVRVLGDRPVPNFAALTSQGGSRRHAVVVERFTRDRSIHAEDVVAFTRAARALSEAKPDHVVPIRDVVIDTNAILIVSEFVDAESLRGLWSLGRDCGLEMPLGIAVRIVLDVLDGLEALHNLTDGRQEALGLVHGELSPSNVLVLAEGSAAMLHAVRVKWVALKVPDSVGYLAPELLLQEGELDHRADIYSAGAMLFEAIGGQPPFPAGKVSAVIRRFASGQVPRVTPSKHEPWAAGLVPVVERAMSVDRGDRFSSAGQMAEALREAAADHVASDAHVAAWVARIAGARILQRRNELSPPGKPRTTSRPPLPGHGLPRPVARPGLPPVPAKGLAEAVAGSSPKPADEASGSSPQPIPMPSIRGTPEPKVPVDGPQVPMPVVAIGEPSKPPKSTPPQPGPVPLPLSSSPYAPAVPGPPPAAPALPAPVLPAPVLPAPVPGPPVEPLPIARAQATHARDEQPTVDPFAADSEPAARPSRRTWIFAGVGAAGLLLVVAILALRSGEPDESLGVSGTLASSDAPAVQSDTAQPPAIATEPPTAPKEAPPATPADAGPDGDAEDAEAAADAEKRVPLPARPRPPKPRPAPTKHYEPMGI